MIPILDPTQIRPREAAARAGICALTVMAKAPRPGTVKTRLSPPLSPRQAAELNICFLRDTTQNIAAVAASASAGQPAAAGLISYTPVGEEALFEGLLPGGFALIAQRGEDFGQRLLYAAQDILACGFASVCLIDSDSPTVPSAAYQTAVRELARPGDRIVLGESADGGYYLIGLKHAHAAVFENIQWSTASVAADTRKRAQAAGLEIVELPLWYDVDDAATLDLLQAELLAALPPGFATESGYSAPHTRNFLLSSDFALKAALGVQPPDAAAVEERDQQAGQGSA
jgi:rSAM/selenodomain-associated transferase 1